MRTIKFFKPTPARLPKRIWLVEYWYLKGEVPTRRIFGKRTAQEAWRIFWTARGRPHIVDGPYLWRGKDRVL